MGLGCKLIQAISVFLVDFLNVVRLVRVKRIETVTYPVPICVWVEDDHGCDEQHHKVSRRNRPHRHSCPPHNAYSVVWAVVFVFVVIHLIIIRFGDGSTQFQMNVVPQKDSRDCSAVQEDYDVENRRNQDEVRFVLLLEHDCSFGALILVQSHADRNHGRCYEFNDTGNHQKNQNGVIQVVMQHKRPSQLEKRHHQIYESQALKSNR